jgi:hypothetical protein
MDFIHYVPDTRNIEVDDESSVDEIDEDPAYTFGDLILLADGDTSMQVVETALEEECPDTLEDITMNDILENEKVKKV